jgi:glyoxylase-like metal-dependent hydrolase (beta-lactamase superfamily II)
VTEAWHEVADRVFVRRYRTWNGEPFDQNVGAVIGADGVLVVDTRASHRLADELQTELRELTAEPVAGVVNTHHHWDHTWGNARFEGVPIWGHARAAERVVADSEGIRREIVEEEPGLAEELGEVEFVPPDRTFTERTTLDLGDRQVELRYLGRGHTDNDIVVLVHDADAIFAGDLLENDAAPSYGDAFPSAWARTVEEGLLPLVSGVVIPGHGATGGLAFVRRQAGELATMADLARRVARGDLTADEAVRSAPFPAAVAEVAVRRGREELAAAATGGHAAVTDPD